MQINLHNYCSFTQWMSSALTVAVLSCSQSRNFWITSNKWISCFSFVKNVPCFEWLWR